MHALIASSIRSAAASRATACGRRWRGCRSDIPLDVHEVPSGTPGLRLDGAARMEHPRRLYQELARRAGRRFPALKPARGELQRAGARQHVAGRAAAAPASRCPISPTGFPIAPPTTRRPGASACATASWRQLPRGRSTRSASTPRWRTGSLTYGECLPAGSLGRGSAALVPRLPSVALQRQPVRPRRGDLPGAALATAPRRCSYRFLFIPGTIGSITWLAAQRRSRACRSNTAWS